MVGVRVSIVAVVRVLISFVVVVREKSLKKHSSVLLLLHDTRLTRHVDLSKKLPMKHGARVLVACQLSVVVWHVLVLQPRVFSFSLRRRHDFYL